MKGIHQKKQIHQYSPNSLVGLDLSQIQLYSAIPSRLTSSSRSIPEIGMVGCDPQLLRVHPVVDPNLTLVPSLSVSLAIG